MTNLVWFRSDLRVDDNPALNEALRTSIDGTIALFFICPAQWRAHDWGAPKVDFVLRSVAALSTELAALGVALLIETVPTFDDVPDRLVEVAREHNCDRVLFNLEYEVNERRRDERVSALLSTNSIEMTTFEEQAVLPPGSVRTGKGGFFTVFSPFKRAWIRRLEESGIPNLPGPARPRANAPLAESSEVPESLEGFSSFKGADLWPAGETEARRRLEQFVTEKAREYADTRDLAAEDGTSALSPYLALGVLSIRRCLAAALAANKGHLQSGRTGIDTWISQLIWRDFYRHVLAGYPRVSMNQAFKIETERISRGHRLDAQPAAYGHSNVPDQGSSPRLAPGRTALHASSGGCRSGQ
jgi:deoxyribodipyrimidine photo-lyase